MLLLPASDSKSRNPQSQAQDLWDALKELNESTASAKSAKQSLTYQKSFGVYMSSLQDQGSHGVLEHRGNLSPSDATAAATYVFVFNLAIHLGILKWKEKSTYVFVFN